MRKTLSLFSNFKQKTKVSFAISFHEYFEPVQGLLYTFPPSLGPLETLAGWVADFHRPSSSSSFSPGVFCAPENSPARFLCGLLQLEVLRDLAGISVPGALTFPVVRHVEIIGIDKSVLVTPIHGQRYTVRRSHSVFRHRATSTNDTRELRRVKIVCVCTLRGLKRLLTRYMNLPFALKSLLSGYIESIPPILHLRRRGTRDLETPRLPETAMP